MSTNTGNPETPGSDLTDDQHRLLQLVYDTWRLEPALKWPLSQYIDRVLNRRHNLDLGILLPGVPRRFFRYAPSPDQGEIILTIEGIAACENSQDDVGLFLRALRWCVNRESAFEPTSPTEPQELRLTREDARHDWGDAGHETSDLILDKAYALLVGEMIPWGSG